MVRDYSSTYNIKDFIVNDIAPKYFDVDDLSMLNVGLFGMVTDIGATTAQDNFNTTSRYITELIPGKSVLPEFIYAQAANYGIHDVFSTCASCDATLFIREDHILENGTKEGNYTNYYIDSDMKVYIDDVVFTIPYDIRIRTRYYNGTYNHNCTYYTNGLNNSMVKLDYPYIKCYKTRVSGTDTTYLALNVKLYQYNRRMISHRIVTNRTLNIPFFDIEFENMLCNFEVIYRSADGKKETQLIKILGNEPDLTRPFCYYDMVDENTFRISFTTNDVYFVPEYNSEIDIYIYETLGDRGNFPVYTGTNMYVAAKSNKLSMNYNNEIPLFCTMTSASTQGKSGFTLDELALKTWEATLSLKSRTTDEDLNRYFDSYTALYDTKALFIRTRDDFATREYACFTRIRDKNNIFPTNTLNLKLNFNNLGGYDSNKNKYILKPGTRIVYDGESATEAKILADDAPHQEMEYTTIALMSLELKPNNMMYYMNSVDKTIPSEYSYVNDESLYQFILKSFDISRNAVKGEDSYHIKVTLLPTDTSTLDSAIYEDNYAGTETYADIDSEVEVDEEVLFISKLHLYLYCDTADGNYIPLKFINEESSGETGFVFECYLDTNDMISTGTIEITNLISCESGVIETCSLDISDPAMKLLVFYEEKTKIGHIWGNDIPETEPYTLCNIFKPVEGKCYLAYPLTLMNSNIIFTQSGDDAGFGMMINGVPLFGRDFLMSDKCDVRNVLTQITDQHTFLEGALDSLTTNFSIHLKFFNTYGKSRIFSTGKDTSLNRTYCSIHFGIKLFNGVDDDCFIDIKNTIKTYIEGLNTSDESSINEISVSQLMSILHTEYSEKIDAIIFYSINGYDSNVQLITMNKDLSAAENMKMVPEFLTINTEDIILTKL